MSDYESDRKRRRKDDMDHERHVGSTSRQRDYNREKRSHRGRHRETYDERQKMSPTEHERRQPRPERRRENTERKREYEPKRKQTPESNDKLPQRYRNNQSLSSPPKTRKFDPYSGSEIVPPSTSSTKKSDEPLSKPSFKTSGKLTADTNTFRGTVIKYNEPPEAAKPRLRWRLYPMKGEEVMQPFYIHRQSAYLIGRDHKISDFPVDHPSCSKQHAVLQYRSMPFERNGVPGRRTLPYIIDLSSANGTFLNNEKLEPQRYYELKEQDILKFGFSSREYVVLHELSSEGKGGEEVDVDMDDADDVDLEGAEERIAKAQEDYF